MSHLEIIEQLCRLLEEACGIIRGQADLLAAHGIEAADGRIERRRTELLERIEREGWAS